MKVLCKKTLYWHQNPGFSGNLMAYPVFAGTEGKLVLEKGKEYEIIALPYGDHNRNHISLFAVGEDSKAYAILKDELHYEVASYAIEHFAFRDAYRDLEIAR